MTEDRPALEIRRDLVDVPAYVSPQHPTRFQMNTNESPYPPPAELVEEVASEIRTIALNRYPDRDATRLYKAISEHIGWSIDGLWIANGSNEVFLHLFLGLGGAERSVLVFEPTYSMHSLIPKIATTRVITGGRDAELHIDLDAALATIEQEHPDIVIVCSPNNPTGDCESPSTIEALLAAAPGLVVVDEAYGEFAEPGDSCVPLLARHPNLIVTKTFSKAWRLAGVRIGYMLADPSLIAELARVRLPYHLSALTQVIGEAAIRHSKETLELVGALVKERDRCSEGLARLNLKVYPSRANFVLFEVPYAEQTWSALLEREVLIRNYSDTPGLENCLRVTAGLPEETDAFLSAMGDVL